uniref:Uncharacterized protein n=1 Tax=Kalanchoe fedtschenkoi TaxID=63787 RepID=A0A7N0UWU4_KALFE
MDSGPSWADQWDYQNPDPLPSGFEDKSKRQRENSKERFGKMKLSLQWVKELSKNQAKDREILSCLCCCS